MNDFDKKEGLTSEQVQERIAQGLQNNFEEKMTKTNWEIVKDNLFTFFNLLNFGIAFCLFLVGAFSNMAFLLVIGINVSVGIYQEITARNLVEKLSIVAKDTVRVIRDENELKLDVKELVKDDLVILEAGNQIPSDMEVVFGVGSANESLLTGESDLIKKEVGMLLLSGSFLASGRVYARVIRVGEDNYATKLASEAKAHKAVVSDLVKSIRKVSKFTSFVIIPLGVILFIEGILIRQDTIRESVVASAAGLLGMLPRGLVLIISIALATGVIKLAKQRMLVQNMYSIETLAHVDMLCLDKTGIITEGKMRVQRIDVLNKTYKERFEEIIGSYLASSTDNNITMQALRLHFEESDRYQARKIIPFSSDHKWGAIQFYGLGTIVLGAPERLFDEKQLPEEVLKAQEEGLRVLMMGLTKQVVKEGNLPKLTQLAVLEIDDTIRENAKETFQYFHNEGVKIKVISGDNPITVSNVARRAGLKGYESYVDLSIVSDKELPQAAQGYTVFGRATPQQKRMIVQELKKNGYTVAMTGDGVNDVLALREADCSIAMAQGDSATRQIANLVLLDSNFMALPEALAQGRRVVNNVTKVASVFFIKTIYSTILAIIAALSALAFPFIPIQITLIDLAIEGYPAFFLSFEGDNRKIHGRFLPTALKNAAPNAVLIALNVIVVHMLAEINGFSQIDKTTLMYYLLIGISCIAVVRICLPLNKLRIFIMTTTILGIYMAAMLFHHILEVGFLTAQTLPLFAFLMVVNGLIRLIIGYLRNGKSFDTSNL